MNEGGSHVEESFSGTRQGRILSATEEARAPFNIVSRGSGPECPVPELPKLHFY